jgi:hypothetical protein
VSDPIRELADSLAKRLVHEGKLIEAGWIGYNHLVLSKDAPQVQRDECRMAFFAGAQHLFGSMLGILEEDRDPTPADLERMSQINAELESFLVTFKAKHGL